MLLQMSFTQFNRGLVEVHINIVRQPRGGRDFLLPLLPHCSLSPTFFFSQTHFPSFFPDQSFWQFGDTSVLTLVALCKLSPCSWVITRSHLCVLTAVVKQLQQVDDLCRLQPSVRPLGVSLSKAHGTESRV